MRSCLSWNMVVSIGLISLFGCGKPAATPRPPAAPLPGQVVAPPSKPVADQAAVPNDSAAGTKAKSKAEEVAAFKIANADPKSVFTVNATSETMEIEATNVLLPTEQFEVVFAEPALDSTKFVIESAVPSPQGQSVVGVGKPKSGFKLPKDFSVVAEWGYSSEGLPLRIQNDKTKSLLALVPAGMSIVGSELGPDECKPSFKIRLDTFYMEVLEVSIKKFDEFQLDQRQKKKNVPAAPVNAGSGEDFPALGITVASAQSYAKWAGMELPTEAEFEKAARSSAGLRHPWGSGKPLWSERTIAAIGSVPDDRSPYGIFDLAGNAKEWCTDLYSPTSHKDAAAASAKETLQSWPGPKSVRDMNLRVVKGNSEDWSAWGREGKDASKVDPEVGFRCILRLPSESSGK